MATCELTVAIDAFKGALAARAEARSVYERTRPAVSPELIANGTDRRDQMTGSVYDTDGLLMYRKSGEPLEIYCCRRVRANLILNEIDGRTKEGRRLTGSRGSRRSTRRKRPPRSGPLDLPSAKMRHPLRRTLC